MSPEPMGVAMEAAYKANDCRELSYTVEALIEAAVQAILALPDPQLERLREGMRELGFVVGRNPDGVDDSVEATLLVVRESLAERDRLLAVEAAARGVLKAWKAGAVTSLMFDPIAALRTALSESSEPGAQQS